VVDDVGAVDRGIQHRVALERRRHRLDEKRHEAELHAVLLLEAVLVAVADVHHRLHVDLVEGRKRGGDPLRFEQPLGDARADARHRHPLLGPAVAGAGNLGRCRQ